MARSRNTPERPIRIELCGGLRLHAGPIPVDTDVLGGRRGRWAFAHLVLLRGRPVTRDALAAVLWPDRLPNTWPSALRTALSRVRDACRALGLPDDALDTSQGVLRLRLPEAVWIDVVAAELDAQHAEDILADETEGTYADAAALSRSAATILAARMLPDAEGESIDALRRSNHLVRMRALDALSRACLAMDDTEDAISAAEQAIADEPLRESSYRLLMDAHRRAGRRGDALRAYERVRTALAEELGVEPSEQTEAAYLRLLDVPTWKPDDVQIGVHALPPALLPRDELPFVGRVQALGRLVNCWTAGPGGPGGLAFVEVSGEPGIGKSRLVRQFAQAAHRDGARVLHAQFDEHRLGALGPVVALLTTLGTGPDMKATDDTGGGLVERLTGATAADAADAADWSDRDLVLDEIADRLADASLDAPLLIVLDDVQWAGQPALAPIQRLLTTSRARIGIVVTVRDGELAPTHPLIALRASAIRSSGHEHVALEGLDPEDVGELLRSLEWEEMAGRFSPVDRRRQTRPTSGNAVDDGERRLAGELWDRTAGNPLYLGESLRHLVTSGELRVDEHGHLSGSTGASAIAPTVRDLVLARVGALTVGAHEVLTTAAVIGRTFDLSVLGSCVDGGLERAVDVADLAIRTQLVRALPDRPGACQFVHGVIHATLLDALSPPRRMALHRRVGLALEARPGAADQSALARHFVEAAPLGEVERAGRHSAAAAAAAIRALAYEEAADLARRALALPPDERTRAELLLLLGRSGIDAGDTTEAHQAFLDAFDAARAAHDPVTMGRAALGATRGFRGGSSWLPEAARRAMVAEAITVVPDHETTLRVDLLGRLALWTAQADERHRLAASAMEAAESDPSPAALIAAYGASRIVHWHPHAVRERIAFADRVVEAAAILDESLLAASITFGTLGDLLQLGERDAIDRLLAELDARDAVKRSRRLRWQRALWTAVMTVVDGRLDDAEAAIGAALSVWGGETHVDALQAYGNQLAGLRVLQGRGAEIVGPMIEWVGENADVPGFRAGLAWALAQAGRIEEARHQLAIVLGGGLARDNTYPATWIGATHAALLIGDATAAAELYELGRVLAGQLVFQPGPALFVGPADHGLGLLARLLGHGRDAAIHLQAAVEVAGRCGPWWVERSRRELQAL